MINFISANILVARNVWHTKIRKTFEGVEYNIQIATKFVYWYVNIRQGIVHNYTPSIHVCMNPKLARDKLIDFMKE